LKIASFNIKHRLFNNSTLLTNRVFDVIKKHQIDVLCCQEIPRRLSNKFSKLMKGYDVLGDSRYHHYLKSLPFNEKNPIITNKEHIHAKTIRYKHKVKNIIEFLIYLKNIPIFPRIATVVVLKTDIKKDICVINTHLDYKLSIVQKKELKDLLELVKEYHKKYDIVLTGDFNMEESEEHFRDFINDLKEENIARINIKGYTWENKKGKKKTLDYMFASSNLKIKNFGIIKSNNLSDHEIIYTEFY